MMKLNDQFKVDGLLLCKKIICEKKIDQLNNKIDLFKLKNKNFLQTNNLLKYNFLNRIINLHSLIHEMTDVYCEIRDKINIFNAHTTLWSSIYYEVGSEQPLHRDLPYFYTGNNFNESFGLWVALEDIYSNNGPLLGVKKSHLIDQPDLKKIRHKHFPNKIHREYSVGGFLGLKIDIDINDGKVGVEIKILKNLNSSSYERLLGQAIYYKKRKYDENLIILIVGTNSEYKENVQKIKELSDIIEDLDVKFLYLNVV